MNLKDTIEAVRVAGAHATGRTVDTMTKKEAAEWLKAISDVVQGAVKGGDEVTLPGIGKFSWVIKAARTGRNPRTGLPIQIPEKRVVTFTAAKELRDAAQ